MYKSSVDDRIMPHNPLRGIEGFKAGESERCYLTLDESKGYGCGALQIPCFEKGVYVQLPDRNP